MICFGLFFVIYFSEVVVNANIEVSKRFYVEFDESVCDPPLGDICVEIRKCPFFKDLLDKTPIPKPRRVIKFIREHQCGLENNMPRVCCFRSTLTTRTPKPRTTSTTTSTTTTSTTTSTSAPRPAQYYKDMSEFSLPLLDRFTKDLHRHRNYNLLPLNNCGPISTYSRITSGKTTGLEEFPWMALIAYNTESGVDFRCGGTLISDRYILTAAHCIADTSILGVRLGEYDLRSPRDCEGGYCSPPVQDFNAESLIVHPRYDPKTYDNDIALIRLDYPANFSYSNVRPICLPVMEINDDLTGKFAIVSGWGITEDGKKSDVLLKVSVPVLPVSTCKKVYHSFGPIKDTQICAGGYQGRDSCGGDSGGPMKYVGMVDGSPRYIQYGIVSFGPRHCGTDGQPGIYTRVGGYIKWILDNMKPDGYDTYG